MKKITLVLFLWTFICGFSFWPGPPQQELKICSFNIQFLGNSNDRDDTALASILKDYDIVVVQELVSPPYTGTFPNGNSFNPDPQSAEFFDAMTALGFKYTLSEEDTGTGDTINRNGSSTEWWVVFFKEDAVTSANDIPSGFLADDRSNHDDYERVPYAFAFRTTNNNMDFVLISVHLKPGSSSANKARRQQELSAISTWIDANDEFEKDFIILGDMNIYSATELNEIKPANYVSLNDECVPTNTNINGPEPYDHVMYNPTHTTEIDQAFDFEIINLIDAMKPLWTSTDPYPGEPYDHNEFRKYYSDHHPVVFQIVTPAEDDDLEN